jgi:ferritin-like metal-binding protein YciE
MTIHDVMMIEVQKLYDTENQLIQGLTFLSSRAEDGDLREALDDHLQETRNHVTRLDEICRQMGWQATGSQSMTARTLVQEAQQMLESMPAGPVTDACIIAAAQKAEHLEMAGYGTAAALADEMDHDNAKDLLGQTLDEEKAADKRLTKIAERGINKSAVEAQNRARML